MKFNIKDYSLKEKWGVSVATLNKIQSDIEAEFGNSKTEEAVATPRPLPQTKKPDRRL